MGKDSHINENRRHKQHLQSSNYDNQQINKVLQNNPNRWEYKRLYESADVDDGILNQLDISFIERYNPRFNFTEGGEGSTGYKHTKESKEKMSKAKKGKYLGKNNSFYNKHHTEETKQKLRESKLGKEQSIQQKISRSKSNNTTGYFRVTKEKTNNVKQVFVYTYQYYDNSLNKRIRICRTDIIKLKNEVLRRNLIWKELDEVK